jgi:hypothetical protein
MKQVKQERTHLKMYSPFEGPQVHVAVPLENLYWVQISAKLRITLYQLSLSVLLTIPSCRYWYIASK